MAGRWGQGPLRKIKSLPLGEDFGPQPMKFLFPFPIACAKMKPPKQHISEEK